MSAQYIYYVYAYLRKDGTPYYIGKGKGERAFVPHIRPNNANLLPKDRSRIIFLEKNLSEIGALALERRMIRWYGRKNNGSGILRNLTDGGEGTSGVSKAGKLNPRFGVTLSAELRLKISESVKGFKHSEQTKEKLKQKLKQRFDGWTADEYKAWVDKSYKNVRGRKRTEETRKRMSESRKGYKMPEEVKEALRRKFKERHIIRVSCIFCKYESDFGNYSGYHGDKCIHRPDFSDCLCECGYSTPYEIILERHKKRCGN